VFVAVYSTRNPARRSARSQSRSFPAGPSGPPVGLPSTYQVTAARGCVASTTRAATNPVPAACPFGKVAASGSPAPASTSPIAVTRTSSADGVKAPPKVSGQIYLPRSDPTHGINHDPAQALGRKGKTARPARHPDRTTPAMSGQPACDHTTYQGRNPVRPLDKEAGKARLGYSPTANPLRTAATRTTRTPGPSSEDHAPLAAGLPRMRSRV
jgi:hypothetical protein